MKQIKVIGVMMLVFLFIICESKFVSETVKAQGVTMLNAPEKVRVKSYKGKKLRLSWKQVEGAEGYVIQGYKKSKKRFVKVAETTGTKTGWTSARTKTKQTYRVCAYRMQNGNKIMGNYSYEVSAIPYKKKAKLVNAGETISG